MKILVVIPTCDRPQWLARCLAALDPAKQASALYDYRVVVSDDGQVPGTELVEDRPWASWRRGPRRGPAANRNAGALSSDSDLILFVDDDCIPEPGWIAAFAAASLTQKTVGAFEGMTVADRPRRSLADDSPINLSGGCMWSCNLAIRREAFSAIGGFDEDFGFWFEDVDFATRLQRAGIISSFVKDARVCHPWRQHRGWAVRLEKRAALHKFMRKHPDARHFRSPRFWAGSAFWEIVKLVPSLIAYRGRGAYVPVQTVAFDLLMLSDTFRASIVSRLRQKKYDARDMM